MRVRQLIDFLSRQPPEALVFVDDEGYPEVDGCYLADKAEFEGDAEDAPPLNAVILELTHSIPEKE